MAGVKSNRTKLLVCRTDGCVMRLKCTTPIADIFKTSMCIKDLKEKETARATRLREASPKSSWELHLLTGPHVEMERVPLHLLRVLFSHTVPQL